MPDDWEPAGDESLDPRERALRHFEAEIREARQLGDARREARAHAGLGSMYADQGKLDLAADEFRACLLSAREGGDQEGVAWSLFHLGRVHGRSGSIRDGLSFLRESHAEWDSLGHSVGLLQAEMLTAQFESELGRRGKALELLGSALERASETDDPETECRALAAMAEAYGQQSRWRSCADAHRRCIPLLEQLGNTREEAHARWGLASALFEAGETDEALRAGQTARAAFRRCDDANAEAALCMALATSLAEAGRPDEALALAREALALLESDDDGAGIARTEAWLAEQLEDLGLLGAAREHALRAARRAGELGLPEQQCRYWKLCAGIEESLGDVDGAASRYRQILEIARDASLGSEGSEARALLGGLLIGSGRTDEGLKECKRAIHELRIRRDDRLLARTLYAAGGAAYRGGDLSEAEGFHREQLNVAERIGDAIGQDRALEALAQIVLDEERLPEARTLTERRLRLSRDTGNRRGEIACRWALADLARRQGDGARLLEETRELEALGRSCGLDGAALEAREAVAGALLMLGRHAEAAEVLEEWIADARAHPEAQIESWIVTLAMTRERLGQQEEACRLWREVIPELRSGGDAEILTRALTSVAELMLARGEVDEAMDAAHELLDLARERESREETRRAHLLMARCHRARGRVLGMLAERWRARGSRP